MRQVLKKLVSQAQDYNMNKKIKIILIVLVIVVIDVTGFLIFSNNYKNTGNATKNNVSNYAYDSNISETSRDIFKNEDALYSYVKKFGPKKTVQWLNVLSAEFGSCHNVAHEAGRFSYEIYNEESFKFCGGECHSGCYHGATEAYFQDHGTANLAENLNLLCSSELNAFFSHQCIHGIGHGLMAWTSYDLPEALESCNALNQRQDSCWTGVFMENIVGGLSKADAEKNKNAEHFTKYLSDDPQYPCTVVEDKYKFSCYFLQTSRMMKLFAGDFKKVADACLKAETPYQQSCFDSMGRDAGGSNPHNAPGAILACSYAPKGNYRLGCLMGAAQDAMWDTTGQDDAIGFCKLLSDKQEKDVCYNMIFSRATEIFTSANDLKTFCKKTEDQYQSRCPTEL